MSKFKNYRNKYTKNNIIHSIDHLSDMNFGEVSKRRKELTSQYKQIGLPTNSELQNSSNVVYVHEYTKDDGTFVHAHWRSKPEGTGYDDQGSDPVTPDKMPTKRPEPYPDDSGDDDENGGTVYNLLKWILIILQAYQLMKSMGNDGNNFVPVNINDSLNNRTDSDYIPNLGVNNEVNDGVNKEINTSIDDKKSLKDIENLIIPREEHSSPFSITPYVPKKDEPVQNTQKNLTTNNKVSADKNQPVLTFEGAKQSELQPISQPMAQHSDDDLKRYISTLLESSQEAKKINVFNNLQSWINKFTDGNITGAAIPVNDSVQTEQKWIMPCKGKIVGVYGEQRKTHTHNGIDIAVPINTPIKAIADGVVYYAGSNDPKGYGKYVIIQHHLNGKIITSEYGHLSSFCVSGKQIVKQGQIIGYSGNTGHSEGPHCHLTIREGVYKGKAVDPYKYINKNIYY